MKDYVIRMKVFILLLNVVCLFCNTHAQDFHVMITGSDENPGTLEEPWGSIQHAMHEASPGSTVLIHRGIYEEVLSVEVSGQDSAWITFQSFEDDEVIVDGSNLETDVLMSLIDVQYVEISGLLIKNLRGNNATGILVDGMSDHLKISNCGISQIDFSDDPNADLTESTNAHPISIKGSLIDHQVREIELIGNEIHACRIGFNEAIEVNGNVNGFLIEGNLIYDIIGGGIGLRGHEGIVEASDLDQARDGVVRKNIVNNCALPIGFSSGIHIDGGKEIFVEQNEVYDNQLGILLECRAIDERSEDIIIRNNFIYGNFASAIATGGTAFPNGSGRVRDVQIVNNSLHGNDQQDIGVGEFLLSYNENLRIANNIISATNTSSKMLSTSDEASFSINVSIQNNNWYDNNIEGFGFYYYNGVEYENLIQIQDALVEFSDNISKLPGYMNVNGGLDLHLEEGSTMIDLGRLADGLNYGSVDIDDEMRIIGSGIDIGADEFNPNPVATDEAIVRPGFILFPNPSSDLIYLKHSERSSEGDIEIYNEAGELLAREKSSLYIDLSTLPQGLYFVRVIEHDGSVEVHKVIKY